MNKIPTLFFRDESNPKLVTPFVDPVCKWVRDGHGFPMEKFDGSACLIHGGFYYRRHQLKVGKAAPPGWLHWTFDVDQTSGHGWARVGDGTTDQYHREVRGVGDLGGGTYELVGPSVQRNPYQLEAHALWRHGGFVKEWLPGDLPTDYRNLGKWLAQYRPIEGIVFYHPDGRMAKIKRRDFGLPWPCDMGGN